MSTGIIYLLLTEKNAQTWNYIILIVAVYLLINVFLHIKKYLYISFEDDGKFLIIKFFNSFILNSGKRKIRIPKNSLVKYELKKTPLHQDLILFVNTQNGLAKYPPLSLSGLNQKEIKELTEFFDSLTKKQ